MSSRFGFRAPRRTRLSGIELRNFKSVASTDVPLTPLTVVAGSNSSGKSSLLQAVLALTQVARRRIDGRRFPLNAELTRLGTFTSLRHQDADPNAPVVIGTQFNVDPWDLGIPWQRRRAFSVGQTSHMERFKKYPVSVRWSIEMDLPVEDQIGSAQILAVDVSVSSDSLDYSCRIRRTSELSKVRGPRIDIDDARTFKGSIKSGDTDTEVLDARLFSGQVASFFGQLPEPAIRVREWLQALLESHEVDDGKEVASSIDRERAIQRAVWAIDRGREEASEFAALYLAQDEAGRKTLEEDLIRALKEDLSRASKRNFRRRVRAGGDGSIELLTGHTPAALVGAQRACAQYLSSQVRYVGPLRHPPDQPFSTAPDPDAGDVGVAGQHVAAVLQAKGNVKSSYPLPPDVSAMTASDDTTLEHAVNLWLTYLDLAETLSVREDTPLVLGIDLVPPGLARPVGLGAVGVGVSQVLPVLVQCLVAGPGALVVLEQPELHLHPGAQQLLADFLLACVDWGQNFLIESHSEYLVLRLRRRIAEDDSGSRLEQISILFAERNGGATTYRPVEMTPTGGVVDWPDGFFDQGPDEAYKLLVAAADRQRRAQADSDSG